MKSFIKVAISVLSISFLTGCIGPNNGISSPYEELESTIISESEGGEHTHSFIHDYGYPATFFGDGVIEHNYCTECGKCFDMDGNEISDVSIPRLSPELSLGVNGSIKADFTADLSEIELDHINWNIPSISLQKDDVITICKKGDISSKYDYFPDTQSNITEDNKVHNDVSNANVSIYGSPNGLYLSISGFEYDGIVIKINDNEYPMNQVSYLEDNKQTYIYGYAYINKNDKVVVIDKDNNITYDYDDLEGDTIWNTYDFHSGENKEIVFDYTARYGFEFDRAGDKKISITKAFAPNDTSNVAVRFDSERPNETLNGQRYTAGSEMYEETMWYINHECVINKEDIISYVETNGLYVFYKDFALTANEKFNISDITNNKVIKGDHLVSVYYNESTCPFIIEGDYIKASKDIYVGVCYIPSIDSISIFPSTAPSNAINLYVNGSFVNLVPDANNMVSYQVEVTSQYGEIIMFADSTYNTLDVTIDATGDTTHISKGDSGTLTLTSKGTYKLSLNVNTLLLKVEFTPKEEPQTNKVYKFYDSNGGSSSAFSPEFVINPNNSAEYCLLNYTVQNGWLALVDYSSGSMEEVTGVTLTEGSEIATVVSYFFIIQAGKTCNFYYNPTTNSMRIVEVI